MRGRPIVAAIVLAACLMLGHGALAQTPDAETVVEESSPLAVTIDGQAVVLDALVVRRPGTDKLPIALITHGSVSGDPREATTDWLRGWAHDFANRGWLAVAVMRRGYGKSGGQVTEDAGTCAAPDLDTYLRAQADDLEAALGAIGKRPDADPDRVLVVGDSAGGAAVMALAARARTRVTAVINVSGGYGRRLGPFQPDPDCNLLRSDLVWNFARFGQTARMPTLWFYAENDSWFGPALVGRMRSAFTGSGGKAELVMLPPFKADGHTLFFAAGGKQLLLPRIDDFLRANGLPSWNPAAFAPMLARLTPSVRAGVETYLTEPTEKALALGAKSGAYWDYGERTASEARTKALAYCKQETKAECILAAQDFDPVAPPLSDSKH